jgi:hypothetical protein
MKQTRDITSRGLRSAEVLAADRPHGDRMKYLAGCKCDECKAANTAYERERKLAREAGDWNGLVPAKKAQRHINKLSRQGVGRRSIAACSDVSETVIFDIKSGSKTQIRARTERQILAVTKEMLADGAYVPATETWELLNGLLAEGYTKRALAKALGYESHALQLNKHQVTVRNAADVKKVYRDLHGKLAVTKEPQVLSTHTGGMLTQSRKKDGTTVLIHRMGA